MLYALYELRGINDQVLAILLAQTEEVGKMLYGWKRKLEEKIKNPTH